MLVTNAQDSPEVWLRSAVLLRGLVRDRPCRDSGAALAVCSRSQSIFDLDYILMATGEKAKWKIRAALNIVPASPQLLDLG